MCVILDDMTRRYVPRYSVSIRRCSLRPQRFRWLLISLDQAHKIHAPISYDTEAEAHECGMAEVLELTGWKRTSA